jgi:uncharacterized protein (DUF885 family)
MRINNGVLFLPAVLAFACGTAFADQPAAQSETAGPLGTIAVPASDGPDLRAMIELFTTDDRYVSRFHGVAWSEERFDRQQAFVEQWQASLKKVNFESLGQQGKIDYILLRNSLENRLARLKLDRDRLKEMEPLLPFRRAIQDLEWSRRRLEEFDGAAAAEKLSTVAELVKKAKEAVEAGRKADAAPDALKVSPVLALRVSRTTERVLGAFRDWCEYNEGFKPEFSWWMKEIKPQVETALNDYAKYMREEIAGVRGKPDDPLIGDPIGREALLADLKAEHVAATPEEFVQMAESEFAWCEAEMKKASNALGFGDDWKAALAKVKRSGAPIGSQDTLVRDQSRAAIKFLRDRDLITIPELCEDSWRIEMHTPELQRNWPFAVYGGQYMGVSYPTDAMSHGDKLMSLRGNNRHFTHNVTPHELIPGHHLQGFYAERVRSYRQEFSTPFLIEGWALYWEFRFLDLGWAGAMGADVNMDKIGILFWRMHRCARIIVSLKYHLGEMSPEEMITYLVDRVGHERFGATSEVRRYIGGDYSPLYQCAYMIGGLQMRALQAEVVPGMTEKALHDGVLQYNSIPIELIRAGIKGEKLAADGGPVWRWWEKK